MRHVFARLLGVPVKTAASCLGHGDPEVIAAAKARDDRFALAHTGVFTSEPAKALAVLPAARAPGDFAGVQPSPAGRRLSGPG